MIFLKIFALGLFSNFSLAASCPVFRNSTPCSSPSSCRESAHMDFELYAKSQISCGVRSANAPYIMEPTEGRPARGTILLLHGLTSNPTQMRELAKDYVAAGFRVVAPILSGHGGSDDFLATANVKDWKKDVSFAGEIAEKLGKPIFIVGHSTGGTMSVLEAAEHPGKYSAIAGLDPALNLDGPNGKAIKFACMAKHFLRYPEQLPKSIDPMKGQMDVDGFGSCTIGRLDDRSLEALIDFNMNQLVKKVCGQEFDIPDYNKRWTFSSLCALKRATDEVNPEAMGKLPPMIAMLSKDERIFGIISKDEIVKEFSKANEKYVVQSEAPSHSVMIAPCSPGYAENMKQTLNLFNSRTATASR